VLQAAAAGQGVALASSVLIGDDVATGRLVKPFGDLSVRGPYRYFIVCPPRHADREKVAAFRAWALEEAARTDGATSAGLADESDPGASATSIVGLARAD
jgi:LysR family glycine cleavage system transcriptional activator